jgi:hypothetical protein
MHVLPSPIQYIKLRSAHKKQKRTALHMLALSGAVRPSHVELRYAAPIASITASRAQPTVIRYLQNYPVPLRSWDHDDTALNMKPTLQWVRSFSSSLVQLAKKTDRPSVDQAVRPVSRCDLLREFFLILLANRLYLPHSLG